MRRRMMLVMRDVIITIITIMVMGIIMGDIITIIIIIDLEVVPEGEVIVRVVGLGSAGMIVVWGI